MARSEFTFSYPFRVRYSEIDAQKLVFNAHYLTYFDTATNEYWAALGIAYPQDLEALGTDFHIVKATVEFRRPLLYGSDFVVAMRIARIGRTSTTTLYELHPPEGDDPYATGESIHVYADQASGRPEPVPAWLRAGIRAYEGDRLVEG